MDQYFYYVLEIVVLIAAVVYVLLKYLTNRRDQVLPVNWPIVGMLPNLFLNLNNIHDWFLNIFIHSNGTFFFQGLWFTSFQLLLTGDPANIHHIMSKNFTNFPKGEKFAEMFDVLGDGIFSADSDLWRYHRRLTHTFLTHPRFHRFLTKTIKRKVEEGLLPILDSACSEGRVIDVEDIFQRFTFDTICTLVTGVDTCCLSPELPDVPFAKALDDAEEVLFRRHYVPESVWKLERWLGIGMERKMKEAWEIMDEFIYNCLAMKKEEMAMKREVDDDDDENGVDLLTLYMEENCMDVDFKFSDKFLRDMFLNLMIAGRDTTSAALTWFFWMLFKNPEIESKIRQEISSVSSTTLNDEEISNNSKLVYLHGALCETLRLYPPIPAERKSALKADTLPSGNRVDPGLKIIIDLYAMGRMESIWGKDCNEMKPERWITERGRIKHEPSYKFLAFNAGPRTCLGKDMAFTQMKAVATSVLMRGYHLQVVNEDEVHYQLSIVLHTKRGLKVKVCKT